MKILPIPHSKPYLGQDEIDAAIRVLKSGMIALDGEVRRFEKKFKKLIERKYAIAVNSGTSALHLSLLSLKMSGNDEVIIPSYVCPALLNAVNYTGAKPVIADVSAYDGNISPDSVRKKITSKTKAIIVPHLFGIPADIKEIISFGIPVIEDCAQSLGAEYDGKLTGRFGRVAVFSFYATKVIATGEGGMIVCDNERIHKTILDLRSYDKKKNYSVRYNYKMTDLSASLGIAQLSKLKRMISKRRKIASQYSKRISLPNVIHHSFDERKKSIYYRYIIKIKRGNVKKVIGEYRKRGIFAEKPIYYPLHRYLKMNLKDYKGAEECFKKFVSLPIYPSLTEEEINRIVKASLEIF
ncbi:MAG: DegT/DnrJ/EryC1/StrS aminotransferase family protein, partial [Candidatus Schekmanbacteria bacterium]